MEYRSIHQEFIWHKPTSKDFPSAWASLMIRMASSRLAGAKLLPATLTARGFLPDSCRAMASSKAGGGPSAFAGKAGTARNSARAMSFFMGFAFCFALSGTRISQPRRAGRERA